MGAVGPARLADHRDRDPARGRPAGQAPPRPGDRRPDRDRGAARRRRHAGGHPPRPRPPPGTPGPAPSAPAPARPPRGPARPPPPRPPPPLASPRTEAEIRARIEAIERDVTTVRGLRFERKVPAELLPVDELKQRVLRQVDAETDESEVRAEARALALLGQVPAGTDLVKLLRDVQVESVLGYYVPGTGSGKGRLYVRGGGGLTPFAEFVLSHELTHAVTDQRFDLHPHRAARGRRPRRGAGRLPGAGRGRRDLHVQRYYQQEMTSTEQLSVARESLSARARAGPGAGRGQAVHRLLPGRHDLRAGAVSARRLGGGEPGLHRPHPPQRADPPPRQVPVPARRPAADGGARPAARARRGLAGRGRPCTGARPTPASCSPIRSRSPRPRTPPPAGTAASSGPSSTAPAPRWRCARSGTRPRRRASSARRWAPGR